MPTVSLIATRDYPYGKLKLKQGDTFDAENERDAELLVTVGFAARAEEPKRRTYRRRDMTAEGE